MPFSATASPRVAHCRTAKSKRVASSATRGRPCTAPVTIEVLAFQVGRQSLRQRDVGAQHRPRRAEQHESRTSASAPRRDGEQQAGDGECRRRSRAAATLSAVCTATAPASNASAAGGRNRIHRRRGEARRRRRRCWRPLQLRACVPVCAASMPSSFPLAVPARTPSIRSATTASFTLRRRSCNTPWRNSTTRSMRRASFVVVRGQHEARADLAIQFEHQRVDLRRVVLVEIAGRLVAEHAGRPRHQRARHRATLALAAGQFAGLVLQAMAQADAFEQLAAARRCASAIASPRISNGIATFSSAVNSGSR